MNEQTSATVRPGRRGPALAFFAKAPQPGQVKTRLCPPLTPEEAAGLYRGFLQHLLRPHPGATTYVFGTPAERLGELRALARGPIEVYAQRGEDLWCRLAACVADLLAAGHDRVVVRNTDSPDLPAARVDEALAACAPGRVVLGPDAGGGYYLIGLATPAPGLFDLADTRAEDVCARTVARAAELGLSVLELAVERDVDTYDDLLALWAARGAPTGR
ncbi:MAG: TIGR04282 family arsenosugar biosynthesis glycosyltransferase [Planctomycetota bacterium]